ncbi:hypothetical protein Leryth_016317 [Lithospermum erythrorhizon]|nr:hypothetical protein Leryth_016317 [Lithospermum erythrorhizon]
MAPAINYWWPSLPSNLVKEAFENEGPWRQCNLLIAHYTPWLLYWWNTQQIFPQSQSNYIHNVDIQLESDENQSLQEYSTQQGLYESYLRDAMVLFGEWEFEPLGLENPFAGSEGYLHIWQGDMDEAVSVSMQRYIVENLPWVHYQEVPNVGHMFALEDDIKYQIIKV